MNPVFATLMLAAISTPAFAIEFTPLDSGIVDFDMPSGNICCSFIPDAAEGALLSCSRVEPSYWTVILMPDGEMTVDKNPGEVPGCGYGQALGNIFIYGSTWAQSGITCTSSESGLQCSANGRGFKLRRAGLTQF